MEVVTISFYSVNERRHIERDCMSLADNIKLKINGFEEIKQKEGSLGNQQAVERTVSQTVS